VSGSPAYLVVDAGTSRTRVRLWRDGRVQDELDAGVGAKDVALAGGPAPMADALRRLIATMRARHEGDVRAVVCSGMITSNVGLVEVPHATAPIALDALARRIVRHDVASVSDLPTYFVPGVKTVGAAGGWDGLPAFDVMRGEEVEIAGLLATADLEPPLAFFHCGSHHKLIELSAGAIVERSATAITGELLAAIRERTILASSLVDLDGFVPDPAAVAAGVRHGRALGLGRAAFLVRVGQTIGGFEPAAVTGFLLGALAALDLQLIEHELPPSTPLVVYGGGLFPDILRDALLADGGRPVRVVGPAESHHAAVVGTVRLLEAHLAATEGEPS
jgi:2-dehydro-3-deoxygalactonokinase